MVMRAAISPTQPAVKDGVASHHAPEKFQDFGNDVAK